MQTNREQEPLMTLAQITGEHGFEHPKVSGKPMDTLRDKVYPKGCGKGKAPWKTRERGDD